jgi:hypothetical protein
LAEEYASSTWKGAANMEIAVDFTTHVDRALIQALIQGPGAGLEEVCANSFWMENVDLETSASSSTLQEGVGKVQHLTVIRRVSVF